ncbi:MAG TPA: hypothetical protein VGT82_06405, partial [Ktedonobacteraceae bacterium]|nr:hypothetical protein [Ktedonobacteraceae bacterium]
MADTPVYQDATERPEHNISASAQPGSSTPLNDSSDKRTSAAVNRPEGFIERQFERIAIVNRGEAAMRLIRAVRELNREEHGRLT